jgi:hypothetical protein
VEYSPAGVVMIAAALARMLVNESALGLTEGHAEALAIVEQLLERFAEPGGERAAGESPCAPHPL